MKMYTLTRGGARRAPALIFTTAALAVIAAALAGCSNHGHTAAATPAQPTAPRAKATPAARVTTGEARKSAESAQAAVHPVYSLIDNRLSAHRLRGGGLLIAAGSAGFAKYVRFRREDNPWKLRQEQGGRSVAAMRGSSASVYLPLTAAQASGQPVVSLRLYNASAGRLTLRFQGHRHKEVTRSIAAGWSTTKISAPAGALVRGENVLTLFASAKSRLEVAWIQVGGAAAPAKIPAIYERKGHQLVVPAGGGLAYYLVLPAHASLSAKLTDASCPVKVTATTDSGKTIHGQISASSAPLDLSRLGGVAVRLELHAGKCAAHLADAALVEPGPAGHVHSGPKPKYVILWIMDALRADKIKTFVSTAKLEVPNFQRLAKSSAIFKHAYVQGNESLASHSSIWTSLYPVLHQMIRHRAILASKWTTIDEVMKKAGLYVSGESANGYITPKRGFGHSWDHFKNHIHAGGGLSGADILKDGWASVAHIHKPWFLYLGIIDTHVSYRAKQPWLAKYDPKPYSGRFKKVASGKDMGLAAAGKIHLTARDKQHIIAIYDSNVSYQDMLLGKLFDKLKARGIADQTFLVVVADHGEELWEDGRNGHGGSLRETLEHVPLLMRYPPLLPAGPVKTAVETIDILPTLAAALGVEPDPRWQGTSLIPLVQGVGGGYPHITLSCQYEDAHASRLGRYKLHTRGAVDELYDLVREPAEKTNIEKGHPIAYFAVADPMWMLRTYSKRWHQSRWGNAADVTPTFAADMGG